MAADGSELKRSAAMNEPISPQEFMKAFSGAQSGGRATAFRETRSNEAMKALVDAVHKNLKELQQRYGVVLDAEAAKARNARAAEKGTKFVQGGAPGELASLSRAVLPTL
jgi:hypothetical protein